MIENETQMPLDAPNQNNWGCLKSALLHFLQIILSCYIWYLMMGRKGILVGFAFYIAALFGKFFLKVFGQTTKE